MANLTVDEEFALTRAIDLRLKYLSDTIDDYLADEPARDSEEWKDWDNDFHFWNDVYSDLQSARQKLGL